MTGHSERIAYSLGPLLSMHQLLSFAKIADREQKVDSLWVPESWGRESFATLGAMSQLTEHVSLGTSIINIYSRTPATVAMAASTMDMLSNNRTIIGLGSSTAAIVENFHGIGFQHPVDRMSEYICCLRLMLSGDKISYNGRFFKINNFKLLHRPVRRNIPIYIAAINKKMLSLAAGLADGILLYLRPLDELKKTVSWLKQRSQSRRFEIACSFICALSNKDPDKARERAAKTLAFYVSVGKYYGKFLSENGFKTEIENITIEYHRNGADAAAKAVPKNMLESLTISGSAEECIKSLAKFRSTGITLPIIQLNPMDDAESSIREVLSSL